MLEFYDFKVFLAVFLRCFGVFALIPLLTQSQSKVIFFTLSLVVAVFVFPENYSTMVVENWSLPFETLIGLSLGFPVALLVSAGSMWGDLFDSARGQSLSSFYDPSSLSLTQPSVKLTTGLVWILVLMLGGVELLIVSIQKSLVSIPPGSLAVTFFTTYGLELIHMCGFIFTGTIIIFLPIAGVFLLTDLSVGFLSKLLPQLMLFSEAFQIKSLLGMIIIACVWQLGAEQAFSEIMNSLLNLQ